MRFLVLVAAVGLFACPGKRIFDCTVEDCESCAVLTTKLNWTAAQTTFCTTCQQADAGSDGTCSGIPTRDGKYVIHGCNADSDCSGISNYCGLHASSGPHNTCVESDAF